MHSASFHRVQFQETTLGLSAKRCRRCHRKHQAGAAAAAVSKLRHSHTEIRVLLPPPGNTTYQRISGSLLEGTDDEALDERPMGVSETFWWFASWMLPGMGMFLEVRRCTVRLITVGLLQ